MGVLDGGSIPPISIHGGAWFRQGVTGVTVDGTKQTNANNIVAFNRSLVAA